MFERRQAHMIRVYRAPDRIADTAWNTSESCTVASPSARGTTCKRPLRIASRLPATEERTGNDTTGNG